MFVRLRRRLAEDENILPANIPTAVLINFVCRQATGYFLKLSVYALI